LLPLLDTPAYAADPTGPPPSEAVYEVTPAERDGHQWVSGFWNWNGTQYVWRPGRYLKHRPGYVWVADSWAQSGDTWRLKPGRWERDAKTAKISIAEQDRSDLTTDKATKPKQRHGKKIDYNDPRQYPRYRQR
jgi:hypothetical protein